MATDRLGLLTSTGQISEDAAALTEQVLRALEAGSGMDLHQEAADMLVTHIGINLDRLRRGESTAEATDELLAEAQRMPEIRALVDEAAADLPMSLPVSEAAYWTLHVAAVSRRLASESESESES